MLSISRIFALVMLALLAWGALIENAFPAGILNPGCTTDAQCETISPDLLDEVKGWHGADESPSTPHDMSEDDESASPVWFIQDEADDSAERFSAEADSDCAEQIARAGDILQNPQWRCACEHKAKLPAELICQPTRDGVDYD